MSEYHSKALPASRGTTLNRLKEELYSLNMRRLLAMQHHSEEVQADIERQIAAVQREIDQISAGRQGHP